MASPDAAPPNEQADVDAAVAPPLVQVDHLTKHFPITTGFLARQIGEVKAVSDVSFTVARGETLGLVGESGSGKTTVGRCVLWLEEPTSGEIRYDGVPLASVSKAERRRLRRRMQIVWQDPFGSLNPRKKVADAIGEPIMVHGLASSADERRERVDELLRRVGLRPAMGDRYPFEFSGGQRQRIGIARALAVQPEFIVADEPVSALDVSIQAQLLNLMKDLQEELGLTYLFVAHDLSVVRNVSDRIAVMYLGKLMEVAEAEALTSNPLHPYSKALLSAVPIPGCGRRENAGANDPQRLHSESCRAAVGMRVPHTLPQRNPGMQSGRAAHARGRAQSMGGLHPHLIERSSRSGGQGRSATSRPADAECAKRAPSASVSEPSIGTPIATCRTGRPSRRSNTATSPASVPT